MDRNTVIGFCLLAVLLFLYLFLSTKSSQDLQKEKVRTLDSLAQIKKLQDLQRVSNDTAVLTGVGNGMQQQIVSEQLLTVENDVLKIVFTNKGGQPKSVTLKKYFAGDSTPVILNGTDYDKISYSVNTAPNQAAQVAELYFNPGTVTRNPDGSQTVSFAYQGAAGELITHTYVIKKQDYLVDWNVQLNGADKLLTQGAFNLLWQVESVQHEREVKYEKQQTNICFLENNEFDYILSKNSRKFEKSLQWVSVAQQFFNTTLISKNNFSSGEIRFDKETNDTSHIISKTSASLQSKLPLGAVASIPFQLYYGPNDYKILKRQAPDMDKIVNLGRDFYAFVRPINKYIVMPVFDFFKSFISSFGLVIAFLTIFIRLLTSPLVYTSYLSGAKMKALRPEIEKMKQRVGNDQQQIGVEQMKLFREAGVNPLGGCIPALLQIPIFFALYSFFNSNIALRGESFLWAKDLSTYDVIVKFPVHIWGLGNHVSLFTLLAVITSFLISLYNMNMTPDSGNPALKYMPYIFPFILLFIFNGLPSALTWYYTVSNVITLALQFVIQNWIIDHDKILIRIEENRKKPKGKPKWQERFEQMQEAQKKVQDSKTKQPRNR
ncbi:MAG TPA: membrane protein insertase YidC [Flavitalea sp.]|nr:membrane protein insertase YidC [Flavitalea sp.]